MARSLFGGSYRDTVGGSLAGAGFVNGENRDALRKRKDLDHAGGGGDFILAFADQLGIQQETKTLSQKLENHDARRSAEAASGRRSPARRKWSQSKGRMQPR